MFGLCVCVWNVFSVCGVCVIDVCGWCVECGCLCVYGVCEFLGCVWWCVLCV